MDIYQQLLGERQAFSCRSGVCRNADCRGIFKKIKVIGFDLNSRKIALYRSGVDPTGEVGDEGVANCSVDFTDDETRLQEALFHIVAVPTPVHDDHTPDLTR